MNITINYTTSCLPERFNKAKTPEEFAKEILRQFREYFPDTANLVVGVQLDEGEYPDLYSEEFQKFCEMYIPDWSRPYLGIISTIPGRKQLIRHCNREWYYYNHIHVLCENMKTGNDFINLWRTRHVNRPVPNATTTEGSSTTVE